MLRSKRVIFHILIGVTISLATLLSLLGMTETPIYIYYFVYILLMSFTIFFSGLLSVGSLFIYGFTLFAGSKILLTPFSTNVNYYVGSFSISKETNVIVTGMWIWVLYLFLFGYNSFSKTKLDITRQKVSYLLKITFGICVIYVTIKAVSLATILLGSGYHALYEGGTGIDMTIARLSSILLFSLIAYKNPHVALKLTPLIFLLALGYLITGVRANAIILSLFVIILYYDVKNHKPNLVTFVAGAIIISGSLLFVQWYRQSFTWASSQNIIEYIVYSQNKTFYLPGLLIEANLLSESKYSVFSILSKIVCDQCTSGQILSRQIMGPLYYEGHGVGGIGAIDIFHSFLGFPIGASFILGLGALATRAESTRSKYLILYPLIFLVFYSHRSNIGYFIIMISFFYIFFKTWLELSKRIKISNND